MNEYTAQAMPKRSEQQVILMTLLSNNDRTAIDRVVFSGIPGHAIEHHPWSATVLSRIGEDAAARDYLATFATTEEGACRALLVARGLAKMAHDGGPARAAALSVAGWCALSLGRWELADELALRSLGAAPNTLAERVREMVAGQWFAEVLNIESDFDTTAVRECSARVLHELTETRAYIRLR